MQGASWTTLSLEFGAHKYCEFKCLRAPKRCLNLSCQSMLNLLTKMNESKPERDLVTPAPVFYFHLLLGRCLENK